MTATFEEAGTNTDDEKIKASKRDQYLLRTLGVSSLIDTEWGPAHHRDDYVAVEIETPDDLTYNI